MELHNNGQIDLYEIIILCDDKQLENTKEFNLMVNQHDQLNFNKTYLVEGDVTENLKIKAVTSDDRSLRREITGTIQVKPISVNLQDEVKWEVSTPSSTPSNIVTPLEILFLTIFGMLFCPISEIVQEFYTNEKYLPFGVLAVFGAFVWVSSGLITRAMGGKIFELIGITICTELLFAILDPKFIMGGALLGMITGMVSSVIVNIIKRIRH